MLGVYLAKTTQFVCLLLYIWRAYIHKTPSVPMVGGSPQEASWGARGVPR